MGRGIISTLGTNSEEIKGMSEMGFTEKMKHRSVATEKLLLLFVVDPDVDGEAESYGRRCKNDLINPRRSIGIWDNPVGENGERTVKNNIRKTPWMRRVE